MFKMKKLMVLLIILGLVNIANAGVLDIVISSLNGQPIDPVKEITIGYSDEVNMDIIYTLAPDEPLPKYLFGLSVEVMTQGPGELDLTQLTWPTGLWDESISGSEGNLIWGFAKELDSIPGVQGQDLVVVDHLLWHCGGPEDVFIWLVNSFDTLAGDSVELDGDYNASRPDFGPGVTIHQPEPMTLALLGLGGLFLRRRK
jgi:hypothetical protein